MPANPRTAVRDASGMHAVLSAATAIAKLTSIFMQALHTVPAAADLHDEDTAFATGLSGTAGLIGNGVALHTASLRSSAGKRLQCPHQSSITDGIIVMNGREASAA